MTNISLFNFDRNESKNILKNILNRNTVTIKNVYTKILQEGGNTLVIEQVKNGKPETVNVSLGGEAPNIDELVKEVRKKMPNNADEIIAKLLAPNSPELKKLVEAVRKDLPAQTNKAELKQAVIDTLSNSTDPAVKKFIEKLTADIRKSFEADMKKIEASVKKVSDGLSKPTVSDDDFKKAEKTMEQLEKGLKELQSKTFPGLEKEVKASIEKLQKQLKEIQDNYVKSIARAGSTAAKPTAKQAAKPGSPTKSQINFIKFINIKDGNL